MKADLELPDDGKCHSNSTVTAAEYVQLTLIRLDSELMPCIFVWGANRLNSLHGFAFHGSSPATLSHAGGFPRPKREREGQSSRNTEPLVGKQLESVHIYDLVQEALISIHSTYIRSRIP